MLRVGEERCVLGERFLTIRAPGRDLVSSVFRLAVNARIAE